MPDRGPAVLHIGAAGHQAATIDLARQCGLTVVATDCDAAAQAREHADAFCAIDATDTNAMLALAEKIDHEHGLAGVYCSGEYGLSAAAAINDHYGLIGCSMRSAEQSLDKLQLRAALDAAGLPLIPGIVMGADGDPDGIVDRLGGYPMVIKPARGWGSRAVRVVSNSAACARAAQEAARLGGPVLAEAHVEGNVIFVFGMMAAGHYLPAVTMDRRFIKDAGGPPVVRETIAPAGLDPAQQNQAHRLAEAAAQAIAIGEGPVLVELMRSGAQWFIMEVTPIFFEPGLVQRATGVNPAEPFFRRLAGLPASVRRGEGEADIARRAVGCRLIYPAMVDIPGRLVRIDGLDEARRIAGVYEVVQTVRPGKTISPNLTNADACAQIRAEADDRAALAGRLDRAESQIRLVIEPARANHDTAPCRPVDSLTL